MNNTKTKPNKQTEKNQPKTRQGHANRKQSHTGNVLHRQTTYHEQERIETRMFD
jgi:hypothetical protein